MTLKIVKLSEVLKLSIDAVAVDPADTYPLSGVYSFGRGLFAREPLSGSQTTYKKFHRLHKNDFVLSQLKGWEGAIARVTEDFDGWYLSPQFPTFRVIPSQLEFRYLEWYLKQSKVWDELLRKARGMGARRSSISPKKFLSLEIPLPPLDEQHRIVAHIEQLAARIEEARGLRQHAIEEAEALLNSKARDMFDNLSVEPTELRRWLDPTRDGIQTGPFGAQLSSEEFTDSGVPVLTIGNIQYEGLKLDGLKFVSEAKAKDLSRYALKEGDILFARMGTVGRCCVVPSTSVDWLINYHIIRVGLNHDIVEPRYIHWIIRASSDVEEYLAENIRGATRQGVNSKIVGNLPCRIPSLETQQEIVDYLDTLQSQVNQLEHLQIQTQTELDALLPSILDKAFKGEL